MKAALMAAEDSSDSNDFCHGYMIDVGRCGIFGLTVLLQSIMYRKL